MLESLPPDLRDEAEADQRGRVRLTPELELTLARRLVEETAPFAEAGRLGSFLVQLTPGFSPRRHRLDELDALVEALAPHRVAIELRNRGWVREERRDATLGWFDDREVAYVCVDAPPGDNFQIMPPTSTRSHATTWPTCACTAATPTATWAARRWPSASAGATRTTSSRSWLDRVEGLAEQAGEVHVAFNNNRDDDAPTAAQRFRALLGQAPPAGEEQLRL